MITLLLKNIRQLVNINTNDLVIVFELTHQLEHVLDADQPIVVGIQQVETEPYLLASAPFQHRIDDSKIF
jgi:hypothetical protein